MRRRPRQPRPRRLTRCSGVTVDADEAFERPVERWLGRCRG